MTVPSPETAAVSDVAHVNPNEVVNKGADKAEEHTPTPIHPEPAPETPVNPGAGGDDRLDALEGIVTGLATTVTTLVETVTALVAKDATPGKRRPWTHLGAKHDHND